jgi:hypothetical protein
MSIIHYIIVAVPISPRTYVPSSGPVKIPLRHPSYNIYEAPIENEIYPEVITQKYLPIGRYGYALTNAPFPYSIQS